MMKLAKINPERNQTLCFLHAAKNKYTVFIQSEFDMTNIVEHKKKYNFSYITYFMKCISDTLENYPELNQTIYDFSFSRIVKNESINGRFTIEKEKKNQKGVYSALLNECNNKSLQHIQTEVDKIKECSVMDNRFRSIRILQKLPLFIAIFIYRLLFLFPSFKVKIFGSFTLTILGKYSADMTFPISGSTLTITVGKLKNKVALIDGQITNKPIMNIIVAFDHRIADGSLIEKFIYDIQKKLASLNDED